MRQVLFLSLIAVCGFFISGSVSAQDAEIEEVVVKRQSAPIRSSKRSEDTNTYY